LPAVITGYLLAICCMPSTFDVLLLCKFGILLLPHWQVECRMPYLPGQ
jgi:hypothetical protein